MQLIRKIVYPSKPALSVKDFASKRNQVLIYRRLGGLGDILMHRMIFEDLKTANPEMKIIFACPEQYWPAVQDHPFIDEIVDSKTIKEKDYLAFYDTSTACARYESIKGPEGNKHRSDIWANHCGVVLENHNMHIHLTQEEIDRGHELIGQINTKNQKTVAFCPVSAMVNKNLTIDQMQGVIDGLKERDYFVFSLHTHEIPGIDIPIVLKPSIREWMGVINAADKVISVDTSAFHFAGGIGKPVVGIYGWADGYVYGKYYDSAKIVQFHRNTHPEWKCGPCYVYTQCCKTKDRLKPCMTNITPKMILDKFEKI